MVTPPPGGPCPRRMAARGSTGAGREHGRGPCGVCDAGLPAERGGDLSVAFAGTPPGADQGNTVLRERQGRVPASG